MIITSRQQMDLIKTYLDVITYNGEIPAIPDPVNPGKTFTFDNHGTFRSWFAVQYGQDLFDTAMQNFPE